MFLINGSSGTEVKQLQEKLVSLGYDIGTVDGIYGNKTENAVMKFQENNGLSVDGKVGNVTWAHLFDDSLNNNSEDIIPSDYKNFYDSIRKSLYKKLTEKQVQNIDKILNVLSKQSSLTIPEKAYMLATIYRECGSGMAPIPEYGKGAGKKYGKKIKMSGQAYTYPDKIFYGRGYVQLTWFENYEKASKKIGVDVLNYPEKVLEPEIAAIILVDGMSEGWFTGKKLSDYFSNGKKDYLNARRIINGMDHAQEIANNAVKFENALRA